jgi:hypothetical protein
MGTLELKVTDDIAPFLESETPASEAFAGDAMVRRALSTVQAEHIRMAHAGAVPAARRLSLAGDTDHFSVFEAVAILMGRDVLANGAIDPGTLARIG